MFTLAETRDRGASSSESAAASAAALPSPSSLILSSRSSSSSSSSSSALSQILSLDPTDASAVAAAAAAAAAPAAAAALAQQRVLLQTSLGPLLLELYWAHAPLCCLNFFLLARRGAFDGCRVLQVAPQWALAGDASDTGRGGASVFGKPFPDEIHPGGWLAS
ncbi:Peptidyl-prolyl cis-trans isomerase, related [Eimeria necatrix]|uniref:peptidylprolyl isomerase n=1 Tax=Eimeria necatrix TaxID=51315 RepID=U6MT99_9EIME|nr:Peptidyl-prolyl cis-trans isomerase, related [Eimeria necatrix]CDJ67241.1 Peptidyl-prolyl cis-trans isomerase, related [Eimeria necatrix]